MTAVLGILNKYSVALAADSAVTVGLLNGDSKIFNRANKLFSLSKYYPIGIMLYNSASFMNTPWEIIIKLYRKQLKKTSFDTVEEYQKDFIKFLHDKAFFVQGDDELQFLQAYFERKINKVNSDLIVLHKINPSAFVTEGVKEDFFVKLSADLDKRIAQLISASDFCDELKDLTIDEFNEKISPFWETLIDYIFKKNGFDVPNDVDGKMRIYLMNSYKTKNFRDFTGLIFAGFGETEIYPQLIALNISSSFNGRLRYFIDHEHCEQISNINPGAICPFAQTDVMHTILGGIDPQLEGFYNNNFASAFEKYNKLVITALGDVDDKIKTAIESLEWDEIVDEFIEKNNQQKVINYIRPLMSAVNALSKEDLAEMAESLIYLTYLKRRITFAAESVGGPVDVALISKGDGFIWIKRKHYFRPELNHQFIKNYLKI